MLAITQSSQFKPSLLLLAGIILGAESLWLSQNFDALGLVLHGEVSGWRSVFGQFGSLAKLLLVILFAVGLLLQHKFKRYWPQLCNAVSGKRFLLLLPLQLLAYVLFFRITQTIYADPMAAQTLAGWYYLLWLAALLITLALWLVMTIDPRWLFNLIRHEQLALLFGAIAGLSVWGMAQWTQQLWGPLSELTFLLVTALLYAVHGDAVAVVPDEKTVGIGDFWVNIAPACSGYEGIGLITAFTVIYLWVNRQTLRFPHVLLLLPIGIVAIWLLNVVRIAVLVSIGHHWSPEIAIGGFHSQAGWITFILTSLALLWLTGDNPYFTRAAARTPVGPSPASNIAIATLVPMMALLAVTLLSSAFTADFDWLYPLRVFAVVIALLWVWPKLRPVPLRITWLAPVAGLVTAVLWAAMLGKDPEANAVISDNLHHAPVWAAGIWLAFRLVGTAVTVPIAEELAFRGYLLCRLSKSEVILKGSLPFSVMAVFFSSLAFGALHGAWLAGTVAGLIYAWVRLRSGAISDAIYAHSITNALLFGYAATTGEWHLL